MVEFRIPLAELISTAVMAVCFLIAVIMINRRAEGRSRSYGVGGLVALAASPVLAAVNDSQGAVYGTDTTATTVLTALVGALAAAGLVLLALALSIAGARGGHRVLAIVGGLLLVAGVLGRFARGVIVERYLGTVDNELIVTVLAAEIGATGALTAAGVLLVTGALVIAGDGPAVPG